MGARRLRLILPLLLAPALAACGSGQQGPAPLTDAALSVVAKQPGAPREELARIIDDMFADQEAGETRAVLIMHAGRIVAERYAPGYGKDTRFIGWSMAKSVTGVTIGLLVADGRLRLDESVPVPEWQRSGDPRGEITLRQLLQMRSGLRHTEGGSPVYKADEVRMLFLDGRDDMAAYAEAQPLEAEPGRLFKYSSASSVILSDVATRTLANHGDAAARHAAMAEYLRTRLFEPLGLHSMTAEYDAAGTLIGSSMIHATARDWAGFGEFLRNGGSVKGAQIVPRDWIQFMTTPSPRNAGYGAQVWLNRRQVDGKQVLFPDKARRDIFACVGHLGQYVVVSPEQRLVVVRLGKSDEQQRLRVLAGLVRLIELFPES